MENKIEKVIFQTIIDEMWESEEIYSNQDNRDDGLLGECSYYYDAIVKVGDKEITFTQENSFEIWPNVYDEFIQIESQIEYLQEKKKLMESLYYKYSGFILTVKDSIAEEYTINIGDTKQGTIKKIFIDYENIWDDKKKEEVKEFIDLHKGEQDIFLL